MMIEMLKAKIHRAVVTEANLEYKGSITIDEDYMDEVEIYEYEKVHVVNLNNGARIETYAIKGERGSDTICLNGAAARYFEKNDKVIIMSYAYLNQEEVKDHKVKVKLID